MNLTARAASCLAALAMTFGTQPAGADPSVCSQPLLSCTLLNSHCHAGDSVYVVVLGAGAVQGLASCGRSDGSTQYIRCGGVGLCVGAGVAEDDGALGCDVQTTLSIAICFTLPSPVDDLGPIICPVLASLSPTANVLPSLLYVENDGDVDVLNSPTWDCPPYGS